MILFDWSFLDDSPEIDALWQEIEAREADDEAFLLECSWFDNEPLSQEEIDAWDDYLSSPEGQREMAEHLREENNE